MDNETVPVEESRKPESHDDDLTPEEYARLIKRCKSNAAKGIIAHPPE